MYKILRQKTKDDWDDWNRTFPSVRESRDYLKISSEVGYSYSIFLIRRLNGKESLIEIEIWNSKGCQKQHIKGLE